MCQNPQVVFPNHKQMVQHVIPSLVLRPWNSMNPTLDSCDQQQPLLIYGYLDLNMTFLFL